jgi:enoyl-[acyl-carrier protein] reductase I
MRGSFGKESLVLALLAGLGCGLLLSFVLDTRGGGVQEPVPVEALQLPQRTVAKQQFLQPPRVGGHWQLPSQTRSTQPAAAAMPDAPTNAMGWKPPAMRMQPSPVTRGSSVKSRATGKSTFNVDLTGKVAFLCGASSEKGYGWAIAKELAEAGATILFGTWPVGLKIFQMNFKKEALTEARKLSDGSLMEVAKVYPLDAVYDDPSQVPDDVKNNKRYKDLSGFTIQEVVDQVEKDFGKIDILVHALANGPEVKKPLLETSRAGYLEASSASAYSLVSMVSRFGRIMNPGGAVVSISYIAAQRVIPGYGGGMSSAKAQLESDTKTLAYEAGRKFGVRVNSISAGPLATRAAMGISGPGEEKPFIMRAIEYSETNSPMTTPLTAENVGKSAFFLLTDMSAGVTGVTLPVDMGMHAMGTSLDSPAFEGLGLTDK